MSNSEAPARSAFLSSPADRRGDRIFSGLALGAGITILVILAFVGVFLTIEAIPALTASPEELGGRSFWSILGPLIYGTFLSAALALLLAVPLSLGIGLFISHYAPRSLAQGLGYIVDLLAAVPSVVYGLWGIFALAPWLGTNIYPWLEEYLGFLPFFEGPTLSSGRSMLTVGIVLSIMILPIMTAINREIFLQTPRLHEEAALALGATRWEMIRMTVLPFGRSGIVSAGMLGLGRALGETMAVAMILSGGGGITLNLISADNPSTIASNIALKFPESSGLAVNELIATGLVLFLITFLVNYAARAIVARRAEFSGAN